MKLNTGQTFFSVKYECQYLVEFSITKKEIYSLLKVRIQIYFFNFYRFRDYSSVNYYTVHHMIFLFFLLFTQ